MPLTPPTTRRLRLALAFAVALSAVAALGQAPSAMAAPGEIKYQNSPQAIQGRFIVVFKDSVVKKSKVETVTNRLATRHRAAVTHQYSSAVRGFSATMSAREAKRLASDPTVAFVEQDRVVTLTARQTPTPSWGLDRVDQRDLPLNSSFNYGNDGSGVKAYIIDTGIRTTHNDVVDRAVWGTNTVGDGTNTDCNGHGTHVAGTVGGTAHGVAKGIRLVAVKVLDCTGSGSFSGVVAGIDWVTGNHLPGQPAVANLSLGAAGSDSATETAVRNSIADGVVYTIASGNSNANACNFTPARVTEAITVNASTRTDARASFSNYGGCTDIFAPGQGITSDWYTSNTATATLDGTSMATPHVAGAVALILGATPTATPATVAATLIDNASANKITAIGAGSPNRLLYVGGSSPPPSGCAVVTNSTDIAIPDLSTATSRITITGCSGNASATTTAVVRIVHSWRGDLVVDLVAPNGATTNLLNRSGGSADNVDQSFTVNMSGSPANGTWTLRVRDAAAADTGFIDSWTIKP